MRIVNKGAFEPKFPKQWKAGTFAGRDLPHASYPHLMQSDSGLAAWLNDMEEYGYSIVRSVPSTNGCAIALANRISYAKRTFWGDVWSVEAHPSTAQPQNLSLTSKELLPHTDFTWAKLPPGYQFLHCLKSRCLGSNDDDDQSLGGRSTLCDGLAVAERFRIQDPVSFDLLSSVKIPFEFRGDGPSLPSAMPTFFRTKGSILEIDEESGKFVGVRFNEATRGALDCHGDLLPGVFGALAKFLDACSSDEFSLKFHLSEGELLVFDNRRLLHGREAYDETRLDRQLEGCYLDAEDVRSRKYSLGMEVDNHL